MEVQSKQKHKKRRTRRNLNEIRRRSRIEVENNVNPSKVHVISKCSNNEQITSKRLTLALFNKTIKSETITRLPIPRVDYNIGNNFNNAYAIGKDNTDTYPTFYKQFQNSNNTSRKSMVVRKKKFMATRSFKPQIQLSRNVHVDENNTINSRTLLSPLEKFTAESLSEISSEEYKNNQELLTHTSNSSSNEDSENCLYEKFMNDLPKYITEHFPALSKGVVNKNIAYLRQSYLKHCHQESHNNTSQYINNNFTINSPETCRDSITQKPMDYIQMGSSWQQSIKNQNSFVSPNSSLLQFGSNSNSTFVEDSPEYLYFPHKLNQ